VVNSLNKFQKVLQTIFITDQRSVLNRWFFIEENKNVDLFFGSALTLRLVYTLNSHDLIEISEYSTLIKLALYLVDQLASFKMSSAVKEFNFNTKNY
jgi:Protein of unknown function (DUF1682)